MEVFKNYKNYKKFENDYASWKEAKNIMEAKKLAYLEKNPIDKEAQKEAIQKGQALLHAIDVMDEYSQSHAENMEVVTEQIVGQAANFAGLAGTLLGYLITNLKPVKKGLENIGKKFPKIEKYTTFIPIIGLSLGASIGTSILMQIWAASKQVSASRNGRFMAMQKDLSDARNFAILTPEQLEQQEKIAKTIPTTKKMQKGNIASNSNMGNPVNIFSNLNEAFSDNEELEWEREEFDNELNYKPEIEPELSEEDILKAKKDKQLLHNIVERIDMASQDYAENIELATDTLSAIALAGGFLTGYISNSIMKFAKIQNQALKKTIPWGIGIATTLITSIGATHLQKEASRVGRYLAKKELEKNTNNFIYVDDEKYKNVENFSIPKPKKDENIFKFFIQAIKDNLEYKKYKKTKGVENIKKHKALKRIKFSDKQIQEAKTLQKNTFKTFNRIDEKSQAYAESVEAVKSIVEIPISLAGSLLGMGVAQLLAPKKLKANPINQQLLIFGGALLGTIPAIFLNVHYTKEQRKASRVAHMLALKEMDDYKNFIDYENLSIQSEKTNISNSNTKK